MVVMGAAPQIYAASIGIQDSIFLMLLALVVFGPRRLPEIGRQIGKLMYEFRKVSNDFKFQMEEELRAAEEADRQKKLQASLPPPAPPVALDVPPHPISAAEPVAEPVAESAAEPQTPIATEESSPSGESDESRGEPRRFPPPPPQIQIQPPSTGETIAAARPFRTTSPAEPEVSAHPTPETVTDSGSEPIREASAPVLVADEGRIGTEHQPGVPADNPADSEVRHG